MYTLGLVASLTASILLIFTGFFIIFKNKKSQSAIYYFYYNITGAVILITLFLTFYFKNSNYLTELNKLSQVFTLLFSVSILNLSLTYPEKEKHISNLIPFALAIPALILSAFIYFTDFSVYNVKINNNILTREIGFLYKYYSGTAFLYFLVSMVIFIRNYTKTKIETYRIQLKYVVFATSAFIIMTYCGSIIIPILFNNYNYYLISPSITSLVSTIALSYSIIAHNIMDIKTVAHKTAMYVALSTSILLPIFFIIYTTENYAAGIPKEIVAGSSIIAFTLFSYLLQPRIDRFFKKRLSDIDTITGQYIKKASKIKTFEAITEISISEIHKGLGLKRSLLFIYDEEKQNFTKVFDTNKSAKNYSVESTFPLIKWFTRNQEILPQNRIYTDDISFRSIRKEVSDFFEKLEIGLIIPFYYENRIYGMICLGNKENLKSFSPDEIIQISEYGKIANDFISFALTFNKTKKEQFISRNMNLSSEILYNSTTKTIPEIPNTQFSSLIVPKYSRGVDYFDFLLPTNKTVGMLCTDVSGMGIKNSFYSIVLRSVFHACINECASPYIIMKRINLVLNEYTKGEGDLVTAFYAFFDSEKKRLLYTNAGFPPMEVFRIEKNDFDSLDTIGSPLGYDPMSEYGQGRTELKSNDICITYTRSMINSKNNNGDNFGLLRLRQVVKENKSKSPTIIAKNIKKSFESFMGDATPETDITVIIMKIV